MQRKEYYKAIRQNKDIKPITPFETNYYLAYNFKKRAKTLTTEQKLEELQNLANVKLDNSQSYKKRRAKKHRSKKKCFVCGQETSNCQHHIILLKNGGYDSGINRIPIGEKCHLIIHPWLSKSC